MKNGYFTKTDIEYEYYFDIDTIKKVKQLNCERYALLCEFVDKTNGEFMQLQLDEIINKIAQLDDILLKIICGEGIDCYETYYSNYNTVLLLNRKIEQFICEKGFKQTYIKAMQLSKIEKSLYDFFNVGNLLFPRGSVVSTLQSNLSTVLGVLYIAGLIGFCALAFKPQTGYLEVITYGVLFFVAVIIINFTSNITLYVTRKSRRNKIKCQYTYWHQPINDDLLVDTINATLKTKSTKISLIKNE